METGNGRLVPPRSMRAVADMWDRKMVFKVFISSRVEFFFLFSLSLSLFFFFFFFFFFFLLGGGGIEWKAHPDPPAVTHISFSTF